MINFTKGQIHQKSVLHKSGSAGLKTLSTTVQRKPFFYVSIPSERYHCDKNG